VPWEQANGKGGLRRTGRAISSYQKEKIEDRKRSGEKKYRPQLQGGIPSYELHEVHLKGKTRGEGLVYS